EYVAATNQRNRANAGGFRFFDRQLRRGHPSDMTGAAVAIDARCRSGLVRDLCLGPAVQPPGAQLAHRRIDVVGALDVMTVQISVHDTVCAELGIFGTAASGTKNSHQKVMQHILLNCDCCRLAHGATPASQSRLAMPSASTRTASSKSSICIASSGLWLPFWLRTKIIEAGIPALANVAASCPAPLAICGCAIPRAFAAASNRSVRSLTILPGWRPASGASSNRTPYLRAVSSASASM